MTIGFMFHTSFRQGVSIKEVKYNHKAGRCRQNKTLRSPLILGTLIQGLIKVLEATKKIFLHSLNISSRDQFGKKKGRKYSQ